MADPLVPAEVDLREFQYMELDVRRLRDSRFAAQVSAEAFRAGLLLWCASWHQQPAASLPDDDIELANLCGFGRFTKEFRKIKAEAMYGWELCSDGRWYHAIVAEKALAAWDSKLHHQHAKLLERLRKENKKRGDEKKELLPYPTFDDWNSGRLSAGIPQYVPPESKQPSAGIPPENPLKGNRTERNRTEPNGTDIKFKDKDGTAVAVATPPEERPPKKPAAEKPPAKSAAAWERYAEAYRQRYRAEPVDNAKARALLCQLVDRLGATEAPDVAAFYVRHNGQWYVKNMHQLDHLVRDAEKLRTEWATGQTMTETRARQADKTEHSAGVWGNLLAEAERTTQ